MAITTLAFLLACTDKGSDSSRGDDSAAGVDADKDGFFADDCDDGDPAIHPGATETCDGVDNDCDGTVDAGASDAIEYWTDADGDGYGASPSTTSCEPVTGSVENGDDCDDARVDVNPDATEICDDLDTDEDCDTLVDDDDDSVDASTMTVWYADADGDGYGDATKSTTACDLAAGYAAASGDCNDANDAINPGAAEVCGDSVDDDCDGSEVDGCPWLGSVDSITAEVILSDALGNDQLGYDVVPAGDTNGDGTGDLLVGAYGNGGKAYVFFGPLSTATAADADAELDSETFGDNAGVRNAAIGDQDNDGYDDLAVSAYNYAAGAGTLYVVLGPVTGTATIDTVAAAQLTGDTIGEAFGWEPSSGDVDGDGVRDVVAGAPILDSTRGASYLFYGPITTGALSPTDADATFEGTATGDWTGGSNAASGDIDGDGIADVVVGAEQTDEKGTDNGAAWLFYGPVSGTHDVTDADVHVGGDTAGAHLGWTVETNGDLDGDGQDDLVVAAPSWGTFGYVYLFYADTVSATDEVVVAAADASIVGEDPGDYLGSILDAGGDLDSDGSDDLAASATPHAAGNGAVYLFYGPISGALDSTKADFTMSGDFGEYLGTGLAFADLDGDTVDDFAVGAYGHSDASAYFAGAVYAWFGTAL
jgi:hypothetical protein